jgi:hypothetical protein
VAVPVLTALADGFGLYRLRRRTELGSVRLREAKVDDRPGAPEVRVENG